MRKIQRYHIKLFAEYLEKLRNTPDGDGSLLDHVILLFGSGISNSDRHTHGPLPTLLLGGGAGTLKGGRHLVYPEHTPLTNLQLTLLEQAGCAGRETRRQHRGIQGAFWAVLNGVEWASCVSMALSFSTEEKEINMIRLAILFVSSVMVVSAADPLDAVREAARGWRQGAVHQDSAALQRFLADDLVYTHGGGKHQSKAEYIRAETEGPPAYESFKESDTAIRLFGDVAVLTGFMDVKPVGKEAYRVRTFEVYVRRNGNWQLAQKESVHVGP